jgi:hypothetical protein
MMRRLWVDAADELLYRIGRVECRLFDWHNMSCRGREDHRWLVMVPGAYVERTILGRKRPAGR